MRANPDDACAPGKHRACGSESGRSANRATYGFSPPNPARSQGQSTFVTALSAPTIVVAITIASTMKPAGRRQGRARDDMNERAQATIATAAMLRMNHRPPVCRRSRAHQAPGPDPIHRAAPSSKYQARAITGSRTAISRRPKAAVNTRSGSQKWERIKEVAKPGEYQNGSRGCDIARVFDAGWTMEKTFLRRRRESRAGDVSVG
jgi:hypothetical protein